MLAISRRLRSEIEDRLRQMPGVVLLGPRQVGKTTLAQQVAADKRCALPGVAHA
jgi:predicted AAA+ superfamily ATPase